MCMPCFVSELMFDKCPSVLLCSAIVSATLKCLMKFYNITDSVRMCLYTMSAVLIRDFVTKCLSVSWNTKSQSLVYKPEGNIQCKLVSVSPTSNQNIKFMK